MDEFESNRIYKASSIPNRQQIEEERFGKSTSQGNSQPSSQPTSSLGEGMYYEIEYDSCPMPGVGKFVLKSQKIQEPQRDEVRELFYKMRDIAGNYRTYYGNSKIFDQRVKQHNAMIFYKQGIFMKDYTDNYSEVKPLSQYFPNYQMMGYEQLRTYFTWRTELRKGNVTDTSLSYAFLYIYELLHNIGVNDPMDGLNQLMFFWREFSPYQPSIDRYVLKWLKDYHIYYQLPHSFKDFIDSNKLTGHYPKMVDKNDDFALFLSISKYDISKSAFYKGDYVAYVQDSVRNVIKKLRNVAQECEFQFDDSIFHPTKRMIEWKPFKDALFYPWLKQEDRKVLLSENEIYLNHNNKWAFNSIITSDEGRQFIGYIMKQIEVILRQITKYKYKLTATMDGLNHEVIQKLQKANVSLDGIIKDAVMETYKEATKTIVSVDIEALSRIREESMVIQEKLVVEKEIPRNSILSRQELQSNQNLRSNQQIQEFQQNKEAQYKDGFQQNSDIQQKEGFQQNRELQQKDEFQQNTGFQKKEGFQQNTKIQQIEEFQQNKELQYKEEIQHNTEVQKKDGSQENIGRPNIEKKQDSFIQERLFIQDSYTIRDVVEPVDKPRIQDNLNSLLPQDKKDNTTEQESDRADRMDVAVEQDITYVRDTDSPNSMQNPTNNIWLRLRDELSDIERNALSVLLHGDMELKKYADQFHIMIEVLVDGINEKSMDLIGDSLIDEELQLYDDYIENVKELIE